MRRSLFILLAIGFVACQKSDNTVIATKTPDTNNTGKPVSNAAKFNAVINNLTWSSARTTTDTGKYLSARVPNTDNIQIKGFGTFTTGTAFDDDAIYFSLENVTDTGYYALSMNNYITYSTTDSVGTEYYSSQITNNGFVRITNIDNDKVSGQFEFTGTNTSGSSTVVVKQGVFTNIYFQK